jgi:hypothetical protein
MAVATAGGMTTSTLLTLFVVPVVYAYMDRFGDWITGASKKERAASEELEAAEA